MEEVIKEGMTVYLNNTHSGCTPFTNIPFIVLNVTKGMITVRTNFEDKIPLTYRDNSGRYNFLPTDLRTNPKLLNYDLIGYYDIEEIVSNLEKLEQRWEHLKK